MRRSLLARSSRAVLAVLASVGGASLAAAQRPGAPLALPVRLTAGLFYAHPVTVAGDTLALYTDTGGGLFLMDDVARRLGLAVQPREVQGTDTLFTAALPTFRAGAAVPPPLGSPGGELPVMRRSPQVPAHWDGMLGQQWFADRVWTFDYPGGRLLLHAPGDLPSVPAPHVVPLHFKTGPDGRRVLHFPRIRVEIDGDSVDLLFDTGASTLLPAAALATLGDGGPAERATSFIAATTFARWRARHPDWRVVENADRLPGMAMIEVPRMSVGGYEVGPVWFTERPDRNFHTYMSGFMDARVDGALGGTALGALRVTVDYPGARAYFIRPE